MHVEEFLAVKYQQTSNFMIELNCPWASENIQLCNSMFSRAAIAGAADNVSTLWYVCKRECSGLKKTLLICKLECPLTPALSLNM